MLIEKKVKKSRVTTSTQQPTVQGSGKSNPDLKKRRSRLDAHGSSLEKPDQTGVTS